MSFTVYTAAEVRVKILIKYPQVKSFFTSEVEVDFMEQMDMFLEDAINLLSPWGDTWGTMYLSGLLKLSMHLLARGTEGETNSGTIKKTKSDDKETEFVCPVSDSLGDMGTTKYGIDFFSDEKRIFNTDKLKNWSIAAFIL